MNKEWLIRVFGIETYEAENNGLAKSNNELAKTLEHEKAINKALAEDFVKLEEELNLLKKDPEQYIEREVEKRTLEIEEACKLEMHHRWYCIGRQDAYAEMGIRAIEAKERGNSLRILENGEIVELITDLEDVQFFPLEQTTEFSGELDEIETGDLV